MNEKRLKFIFDDYKFVEIKLLDNQFVSIWLEYFVETLNTEKLEFVLQPHFLYNDTRNISKETFTKVIDELTDALSYISKYIEKDIKIYEMNICDNLNDYKERFCESMVFDRNLLNYIHRIFTTLIGNNNVLVKPIIKNNKDLLQKIHILNKNVHFLETCVENRFSIKRKKFDNRNMQQITCTAAGDIDLPNKLWSKSKFIKEKFDPLTDNSDYTVWLNEDILGKDMIRAWLDDDDINQHDITGNLFLTPNLMLDPYKNYHNILISKEWKDYYSMTHKTLDRFPIGNICASNIESNNQNSILSEIFIGDKAIYQKL